MDLQLRLGCLIVKPGGLANLPQPLPAGDTQPGTNMGNTNPRYKSFDPKSLNWEADQEKQQEEVDLPAATLDDVFMVYTYDHREKDFVSNTLIFGGERAVQAGQKLADGCKGASKELDKEIADIKDDRRAGFITIKEATDKIHEVYQRYDCEGWDEIVRSKAYPETGVSLGIVDIPTFLHLLPHEHLLDYALNLSEKAFLD